MSTLPQNKLSLCLLLMCACSGPAQPTAATGSEAATPTQTTAPQPLLNIAPRPATPLSQEELRAVAADIGRYVQNPFAPDWRQSGGNLMAWLFQSPDVDVLICSTLSEAVHDEQYPLAPHLLSHMTLAMARHMIDHPEAHDQVRIHLAGARAMVAIYRAALREFGDEARHPDMERLDRAESDGLLDELVAQSVAGCGSDY